MCVGGRNIIHHSGLVSLLRRQGSYRESGDGGSKITAFLVARFAKKAGIGRFVLVGEISQRSG